MIGFIVLFFPAVLSVWIFETLRKEALTRKAWLYRFCLNTLLINLVCFGVKKWILGTGNAVILSLAADMSPSIACNYLIMALPLAIGFGILQVITKKCVRVETAPEDENDN